MKSKAFISQALGRILASTLSVAAVFLSGCISGPSASNPVGVGPLGTLDQLKNYETRRVSSCRPNWRNENSDAIEIAAGGTAVIAELEGPGKIAHIWFTVSHVDPAYASKLMLRMYWDGEEHPSVECPLGDFFGIGMALNKSFTSLPVRVSSLGRARNCYWPMPFRKSARITVTNESDQPCRRFFYYVDWQKHRSLPRDTAYFHAMYRQEFPPAMGTNYVIADITGRGHYVGTVQSVYSSAKAWYGEGDDFFFIDGAEEPQLRGTGTEDYFCDAWCFSDAPLDGPFYGVPVWEGRRTPGCRSSAYRFHVPDPITFRKSLRVEIEHKGAPAFIERDDLMSSVAFWYQVEPHKPWPALPRGEERVPYTSRSLVFPGKAVSSARHSDNAPRMEKKQLVFAPDGDGAWLELPFETTEPVSGDLVLLLAHSTEGGIYRVKLDGSELGKVNLYAAEPRQEEHPLGRLKLSSGEHLLRFELLGKGQLAGGSLGFDELVMRIPRYLPPEQKR